MRPADPRQDPQNLRPATMTDLDPRSLDTLRWHGLLNLPPTPHGNTPDLPQGNVRKRRDKLPGQVDPTAATSPREHQGNRQ